LLICYVALFRWIAENHVYKSLLIARHIAYELMTEGDDLQIMLGLLPRTVGLMLLVEMLILGLLDGTKMVGLTLLVEIPILGLLDGSKTLIKQLTWIIIQKPLPLQRGLKKRQAALT
jgi:hypothetical protein